MYKLSPKNRSWVKAAHVASMGAWVGASFSMNILILASSPSSGEGLYATNSALKLIDDFILIPSAIISLLTGLLISWLTPWGFFKWRWITLKWILTIGVILLGTFGLGPWVNGMTELSAADRLTVLQNPTYDNYRQMLRFFSSPILLMLITMVLVSVIKPWGRSKSEAARIKNSR